ncbi:MAG: hypothetical protein ACJARZ_002976, partial [Dokdonia sp.]
MILCAAALACGTIAFAQSNNSDVLQTGN